MASFFGGWWDRVTGQYRADQATSKMFENAFNKAFYEFMGSQGATYDYRDRDYIEKGYNINPDIFSIISQQYEKMKSVPYQIFKVKDENARQKLNRLEVATKGDFTIPQLQKKIKLKLQAFNEDDIPMPLQKPNPYHSWSDIVALYELFMQVTGNFYLYTPTPTEGVNAGVPQQAIVLPSHLMEIVLKPDADLLNDESVIDHYILREGNQWVEFSTDEIMHIKDPNPNFGFQGQHLYGMSRMRTLLRIIESSNDALDQNVKTMKNGGVFGFIHAKEGKTPFTPEQALQIKEKMKQMDKDPSRLSHISGASIPLAFTKLSLNTDELKPFDFLDYNIKTMANVLGWDVRLLNNTEATTRDNLKVAQRNVIINHIVPRLTTLQEHLTEHFIRKFKGYEDCVIDFDYTELPEMQENIKDMVEAFNGILMTGNERRELVKLPPLDIEEMNKVYIDANKRQIDEVGLQDWELNNVFREEL